MKIAEMDTDDLPIWMCAAVDAVSENCKKRLKTSPQYSRIVEESDKLLFQYPFISTLIDRDKNRNANESDVGTDKSAVQISGIGRRPGRL